MAFELATAFIGLAGAVIGGGITSTATVLIARNERQKFRRERAWDLRREAYTIIIGSLDRASAITKHIDDEYGEDPHGWHASENNHKAQAQMIEFFHTAREAFHANRLVLSKAFVAKYEEMNCGLEEADNPNLVPPEAAELAASVMQRIVPEMEEVAIRELGLDSSI
jgi:hypothetical protein